MKRKFDLIVSLVGLVSIWPVLAIIGLLVLVTSGRPIVFSQVRVGKREKRFKIYKFRTMHHLSGSDSGYFEPGSKYRLTSIGQFLRMHKLDELPQLWNVLKGDMAIVGPRPEVSAYVAFYPERWKKILSVRPGITDPASLLFRNEESFLAKSPDPEKTYREFMLPKKLDIYDTYIETNTIWGDLGIIAQTIFGIVGDKYRWKW